MAKKWAERKAVLHVLGVLKDRLTDEGGEWPTCLDALRQLACDATDDTFEDYPPNEQCAELVKKMFPLEFPLIAERLKGHWSDGVPECWKV